MCIRDSFIGTLSQTLTLRAAFASSTYLLSQIPGPGRSSDDDFLNPRIIQADFFRGYPFSKGAIGACGLSIAAGPSLLANSGPASDDALLFYWDSVPNYLNPPNPLFKGAHQASVRTRAHGHRFAVLRPASHDALLLLLDNGRTAVLPAANCEAPEQSGPLPLPA